MLASLGRMSVEVTLFTDPACPFAFSAEPVRQRLRWHYGDQLVWSTRMIVLTDEPGEAEKLAAARAEPAAALRHADRSGALPARVVLRAGVPRGRRCPARRPGSRRPAAAAPAGAPHGRRAPGRPRADRRGRAGRRPRPRTAPRALAERGGARRARRRPARGAHSDGGGARAEAPPRRRTPRAALRGAELRAGGRRWDVLDPRLQSLRGLRDGAREPRPVARAPATSRATSTRCSRGRRSRLRRQRSSRCSATTSRACAARSPVSARPTAAGADFYWQP